ncbi:uncharacterized protein LOC119461228 isoform X1 [Dermacentor silvarum]|uniref:uncharacterized protein LOC119461228 isoform X1 n=1 Tax=Dermacentor silvarum TaxID=543639 RepID=UPI001897E7FD|nr:uncharacterized protein LOC119461228 isoform X1 [Dermacentor silvarum]
MAATNLTTDPPTVPPERTEANAATLPSSATSATLANSTNYNASATATEGTPSPDEGGNEGGFLGDAGPGMAIFVGALAVISVGVIIVLCVSVCITASKRAKRRAHFQNKIRSQQCPPCPQCNEPCKQDPGAYHVHMCDYHGPVPPSEQPPPPPGQPPPPPPIQAPPMPSVREEDEEEDVGNPFFVRSRDRPERSAGADSGVSSRITKTPDPFSVHDVNHDDRDGVLVSRPKLLQMPVGLFKEHASRVDTRPLWRGDSVDDGVVLPGAGDLTAEDDSVDAGIVADTSVQTTARGRVNSAFLKDMP